MTAKFKFYRSMSQGRFLHNLKLAKKTHQYFRQFLHTIEVCEDGSQLFMLQDSEGSSVLNLHLDFPSEDRVIAECEETNFEALETLLVFDLLESLDEKALVRFIDTKFFYSDGEFFVVQDGPNPKTYKLSSDRETLLEVERYHIPLEIRAENSPFDFI
jgi:hypothetical protein